MKWIMGKAGVADDEGFVWELWLLEDGTVTIQTPNAPEHWSYGEQGPTFRVGDLLSAFAIDPSPDVLMPKPEPIKR